jgi:CRP-like cAMP-binding protein
MQQLTAFILKFIQPTEEELDIFLSFIREEESSKGKMIIKTGIACEKIYFVKKGILKYTMPHENDKVKTTHIATENDLVSDFFSFYSGYPGITNVETLTDCELLYICKKDLTTLYDQYKIWERFGRFVAEAAVMEQMIEKINFQTKSPEQRYKELIAQKPGILQEINLGIIAEYLGITQETLSRIRARI